MRKELILAQGYLQAGLLDAAADEARAILTDDPADPGARYILGSAFERMGYPKDAMPHLRIAAQANPEDPIARHAYGLVLYHLDYLSEALRHLQLAKDLGVGVDCDETLGACLMSLSCPDQAEPHLQRVADHRPDDPTVWANLATALIDLNRCDEAIAACDRALALNPDHADAHMSRSIANLLAGDWRDAWGEYEWRWQTKAFLDNYPQPTCPRWQGEALPAGARLWVRGEQGYGDQIQFARFMPMAAERSGAQIVVSANANLHGLLKTVPGVVECVDIRDVPENVAAEIPMQSLAHVFDCVVDTVPATIPVFTPVVREDLQKLPAKNNDRLRVGVVWAGKPRPRNRSIDPQLLTEVFAKLPVEVYSFQMGPSDYVLPQDGNWIDLAPRITDFSDTAALLQQMDAVVSVDTGVGHLAGSLGIPTCLMLIHGADWRWLRNVGGTPWYPHTILLRQEARGDWSRPLIALEAILKTIQNSL